MSQPWQELLVSCDQTVRTVIGSIDRGRQKLVLVVDANSQLLGTVSDGDVRRALLRGLTLEANVTAIMNKHPTIGTTMSTRDDLRQLMRSKRIDVVPIIDDSRNIISVEFLDGPTLKRTFDNLVVLMAGGKGLRLLPLTQNLPKPLIRIGDQPLLEIIIRNFARQGFHHFVISINFLGQMIRSHFDNGSRLGISIEYVEEESSLGTAGSLGLLKQRPDLPLIVSNGDLLTDLNHDWMVDFHAQHDSQATVAVREYDMQVPFGVVSMENGVVKSIDEKPVHRFFVNAGVYVLNPGVLDLVERNAALDMPQLLERVTAKMGGVSAFPLRERWLDIGRPDDLKQAELELAAT